MNRNGDLDMNINRDMIAAGKGTKKGTTTRTRIATRTGNGT